MPDKILNAMRDVKDFPTEGVIFKDISPILEDPVLFKRTIDLMAQKYGKDEINKIVAIDARGFIFGSALAYKMGVGLSMMRKKGKLPWETVRMSYDLEYGSSELELHKDAVDDGDQVLLIDDVLATGGTAEAAVKLVESIGGHVKAFCFLMESSSPYLFSHLLSCY